MKSDLPKVLVPVAGRPMIHYVLDALQRGGVERMIVVVGYRADLVRDALRDRKVEFAMQAQQLGTGHAVMACRELLVGHRGPVLVLAGDQPMTQPDSVAALLGEARREPVACLLGTAHKENPFGLGRVLRDAVGNFAGIVEEKDATDAQRRITEVNMSYYVFHWPELLPVLDELKADNVQKEYYITDAPGLLLRRGKKVRALDVLKPYESLSINTVEELAAVENAMQEMARR
jgi:bifunctional UDP-N-acetylglucosamine pyrophosphorylase/glucosamine-1-phosphate N-acetyltransferase/UDP-N-acetylglucosamine pyrophosphorylase